MIRLTLNAHSDSEIHLFNKSTILIGTDAPHVDLVLPGSDIQPIHLKIVEQKGLYHLINLANDPFVSVNGHPFGKKLLNSGDNIILSQTTLLFETLGTPINNECEQENGKDSTPTSEDQNQNSDASALITSIAPPLFFLI